MMRRAEGRSFGLCREGRDEMYRLEQGRPGQMPEIIEFAKRAFSTPQMPVDFPRLLPKLYGLDKSTEDCHTLLYNGHVLEGMYALRVISVQAAGLPLRVGWIGTVAVSPEARGKGHLQRLMEHANLRLEQLGCDLGVLGGHRQRYQRFGYEYAGTQWEFELDGRNLRQVCAGKYRLQRLAPDSPFLHRISCQHSEKPIFCQRPETELYDILCSWQAVPWVILKGGEYAGYCTVEMEDKNAILREFCPLDGADALPVCRAALRDLECEGMQIVLPPWPGREQKTLAAAAGRVRLAENHNYRVVHWQPVLQAAAAVRQVVGPPMADGALQFALQEGPALELRVEKGRVELEQKAQRPSREWQPQQAVRLLLGPDSALADPGCAIPPGWLPLPLSFSWQDGI